MGEGGPDQMTNALALYSQLATTTTTPGMVNKPSEQMSDFDFSKVPF